MRRIYYRASWWSNYGDPNAWQEVSDEIVYRRVVRRKMEYNSGFHYDQNLVSHERVANLFVNTE